MGNQAGWREIDGMLKLENHCGMEGAEDAVRNAQVVDARARNISHNVRCTECGSQSIEDSQADVAILLRKLIRDEIRAGKSDKDIYKKLEDDFGETVLYAPKFDLQTAALWLSPVSFFLEDHLNLYNHPLTRKSSDFFIIWFLDQLLVAGAAGGIWAYSKHRQNTNVHIMALNLVRGVPLTPKEKQTMLNLLTPPRRERNPLSSLWRKWLGQ
ncbi:hypothetical protein RHMOL_Rhmol09G0263300 [Rhododendron molle]|uniref:Uncharacterized protein n=1 Tax=Rhododendron molle TaxID=49168 RepID=A0ACC0MHF9_RHOML|nr:hypothetical protein RHMOL_Rhmol09G0263300 [Rhododendron molle]